ncbi:MAG TPA: ATP-dependent DNA helicase [Planctomycetota bacterium]|nr:ATP-dependent DNA helicase [Planctomycetota bacterium]
MDELTPQQADVVLELNRPVLVQAGPGSGKTRTLVSKFVHLTEKGTPFDRILALTFSTKAAAQMRHKIEERTRRSYGRLWVSTFHSFGHSLLQQFAPEAGIPRTFRILTGFKEWVLVRDVLHAVPDAKTLAPARELRGLVGEVANAIGLLKHNLVSPDDLDALSPSSTRLELLRDLASVYRAYELELRARRHLDYRDLVVLAKKLLEENETVRRRVQGWFDAILLDELQDVDLGQVALVGALVRGSSLAEHVTACGDVNQSIYAFRGAIPREALDRLAAFLANVKRDSLDENHRARPELQALSARVLHAPAPKPIADPKPLVHVRVSPTGLAEATSIARQIKRLHGTPNVRGNGVYRWSDMAVLCRSIRRDGKAIENELDRLGIPYRVHGNSSFYRNAAVSFLVNYVLALVDEQDDAPLRRVLASSIPKLPTIPLAQFLDRVSYRGRHAGRYLWFLRFLMERDDSQRFKIWRPDREDQEEAEEELEVERRDREKIRAPYFYGLMTPDEKQAFYDFHQTFLFLRARARRAKDALPALVSAIATRTGLIDWILQVERTDPREGARLAANLTKLHDMVFEYTEIAAASGKTPLLSDLAAHLRELLEHFSNESEIDAPNEEFDEPEDAVSVMTAHQSKGLEFEAIFVPALVTGHFPTPPRGGVVLTDDVVATLVSARPDFHDTRATSAAAHLDEERRLFYVAVTRAREKLFLSWARRYASDEDESAPSTFLIEALGGNEHDFWKCVQDGSDTEATAIAKLAGTSASPPVLFQDDDDETDGLESAATPEELEIALRRLHARGDAATRKVIEKALEKPHASALDRAFVLSKEPFPREEERPMGLLRSQVKLSASRLGEFKECPRKFFYSKLLHLEPGSNMAAIFGTVVHEVLRRFHETYPDRDALRTPAQREEATRALRERLEAAIRESRERFGSEFEFRRSLAQARAMVDPYVAMLATEPLRFVAGRELEIEFEVDGVPMIAKIDRVASNQAELEGATEVAIADYKTVNRTNPHGVYLRKLIEEGEEIQLVTYYQAYVDRFKCPPSYLGKIFLKHRSAWREGTLQVLLKVTSTEPPQGDDFRGRRSRTQVDRAWIAPSTLDTAWTGIRRQIASIFRADLTRFEITPSQAACKYCSFATICGKEESRADS